MKQWKCTICNYIHEGDEPPDECPICGADKSMFIEVVPENEEQQTDDTKTKDQVQTTQALQAEPEEDVEKLAGYEQLKALLVKHHIHPITVHTPNGLLPAVVILLLLSWFTGSELLAKAAAINLVFAVLALPVVIFTGIIEWQKKYLAAMTPIFKIKIAAAVGTTIGSLVTLIWYLFDNTVLTSSGGTIFLGIAVLMFLAAAIAGHIGGKLVFKD